MHTSQTRGSDIIWKNIENDTLPTIVPSILQEQGRTCRNIGSVDHKEVGGRNGGQERIHSVEVVRKGGIVGVAWAEGIADSYGGNIDGQRVLRHEVLRDDVDKKSLIDRAFETHFSSEESSHFI